MQFSSALRAWPTRAVVTIAAASLLAACGGDSDEPAATTGDASGAPAAAENVTLKVGLFGTMGFKEAGLFDEYMLLNPNVKIEDSSVTQEQDYYSALQTRLAAGSGTADVQGIEVGRISDVTANQADKWVDLNSLGADTLKSNFYEWKWSEATTADGQTLGLGTDIGPQAICYRRDLFEKAGLPTDREEVAAAWTTWPEFIALGKQYTEASAGGAAFIDSAGSIFAAATNQGAEKFYKDGNLIHESNPAVRQAWDWSIEAANAGMTAKLQQFTPEWESAFSNGAFATVACPAWMQGYISDKAGAAGKGKWDIATMPGGSGNWGGSYLGIPKASKNQEEAYKLISWLTDPEQQVKLFEKRGMFPSSSVAAADPKVASATNEYFNDAPIGELFGKSAAELVVQQKGPKDGVLQTSFSNALVNVEQRGTSGDEAWDAALKDIKAQVG